MNDNKFIDWINEVIEEAKQDNLTIEDVLEDITTHFNLIYTQDIKETFNKYNIEIMEIIFSLPAEKRGSLNNFEDLIYRAIMEVL